MAKYTMELWEVIECGYNIFDFEYNFYDEEKKQELQEMWFEHFKFHEIGSETVERFKDRLKSKWFQVIDKFSSMFEVNERIKNDIDILSNFNTESKIIFNDTPKGEIVFDNSHATNYSTSSTKGYSGTTASQLLKDYNQNSMNIFEEFTKEFSNLFMQIF